MTIETEEELMEAYAHFFSNFRDDDGEFVYIDSINQMIRDASRSLSINYNDLVLIDDTHELDLASTLMDNPYFMLSVGTEALGNHVRSENPDFFREVILERDHFNVRFYDIPSKIKIRDIRAAHVDSLKWLEGIVIRTTEIKSIITEAYFTCTMGHEIRLTFIDGVYHKPDRCIVDTCKSKEFGLDVQTSKLIDWQYITLQEKPEDLPPGSSPKAIACRLTDDIVNLVRPGDRVRLGGAIRTKPSKMLKKGQILTFDIWIDVNFVESLTKEEEFSTITPEEEKKFLDMAQDPKIHERIIESIAPAIYGLNEVKEASMLLLFSGVSKVFPDGFTTRGQPNILLVGDPGVAKSQLLRYIQGIAPRGIYTSGKGSSAAGLTAAIIRDPDTGEITLEAGALVLADRGICLIDEFDKMNENDRSAIHETMEQHSYHGNTRIRLSNGKTINIGTFVDGLFEDYPDRYIEGINCEILPINDLDYNIITTDFEDNFEISINRVSRHEAPDHFYRITFDHGQSITVTPDHPVFVANKNLVETIPASVIKINDFIPAPRQLSFNGNVVLNDDVDLGRKKVNLPSIVDVDLARFLGYYCSEGYSYHGSSYEIGLCNTNPVIIQDMIGLIERLFDITPIDNTSENRTLRIISKTVYNYLIRNFPNLIRKAPLKEIPWQVFSSDLDVKRAFIEGLFDGDGSVESERVGLTTSSGNLANDISDLLLSFGIFTRITIYNNEDSRDYYKVYITGNSLDDFVKEFDVLKFRNNNHLQFLLDRSQSSSVNRDTLPTHVGPIVIDLLTRLNIPYKGDLYSNIKDNNGIGHKRIQPYLVMIQEKLELIENSIEDYQGITDLRLGTNMSQSLLAKLGGTTRGVIDYSERNGYSEARREEILKIIIQGFKIEIEYIKNQITLLKSFNRYRWLRIRDIEKIKNSDSKWVYDITIEPTRNFMSQGVILHNTVSVAKAGIVATLNARTGVFAAANPKHGRYEPHRTFAENVNLSPAILSRFDLVFILRDVPEEDSDTVIATHILNLHRFHGDTGIIKPPLNQEQLKKYITYAKQNFHPVLSEEATELIENFYVGMRSTYGKAKDNTDKSRGNRVTITARQLEGIIRLSEGRARAALRHTVTKQDAQKAIELVKFSLSQIAIDPETGVSDIDAFYSGKTQTKRNRLNKLLTLIEILHRQAGGPFDEKDLYTEAENENLDMEYVRGAVDQLLRDGAIYRPKAGILDKP